MRKIHCHFLILVHVLILLLLCSGPAVGQAPVDKLLKRRINVKIDEVPFITVVATISRENRLPVGLELSSISYEGNRRNFEATNETLEQVLNLVCQYWPAYRWEVKDGVINFVPANGRDLVLAQLLSTKISHFSPGKDIDTYELRNAIIDLPEVKSFLDANAVTVFRLSEPGGSGDEVGAVELSVSDTDVKGILNKIIRDSEHRFWTLSRRPLNIKMIYMAF